MGSLLYDAGMGTYFFVNGLHLQGRNSLSLHGLHPKVYELRKENFS
jgi:hypothetical protein